jgi:hypothetical protein
MAGGLASSNQGEYVSFVNHLNDTDACPEIANQCQTDLFVKFEYFKAPLSADGEVSLILVEAYVNNLVFLSLHL